MRLSHGILAVAMAALAAVSAPALSENEAPGAPPACFEGAPPQPPACQIDKLVSAQLAKLGLRPASICSDAVFVRRAYLDVIGKLPTAQEAESFIADPAEDKRTKLLDSLLDREEFADYWAMKWSDTLRIKAEFPVKLWPKAAQGYHRWVRTCIAENRPYNRVAHELLMATGSSFYVPEVNFQRAVQNRDASGLAKAVALTFMGMRAENWPQPRVDAMAAFFSQVSYKSTLEWKEEIVYLDPAKAPAADTRYELPDGSAVTVPAGADARKVFADWLVSPRNPHFARCAVNRIWYWLMGRGIIQEPDDIRPDNPPSNPKLLAYLERELVASGYDLKHVYRLILNSQTYQRSSIPPAGNAQAAAKLVQNFGAYPLRRLEAEVLIDALCQITGTGEEYSSAVPEPFIYLPKGARAVAFADGNTSSAFLELFGRPGRDTGFASERNDGINAAQRLHMLNSSQVRNKIVSGPKVQSLLGGQRRPGDAVRKLYLTILSRPPLDQELQTIQAYGKANGLSGRDAAMDLVWALVNSDEFLYRH